MTTFAFDWELKQRLRNLIPYQIRLLPCCIILKIAQWHSSPTEY